MKLLGFLLAAAVALASLRAALAVLVVGVIVLLLVGLCLEPQAVIGVIALCVVAGLVQQYPLPCLGVAASIAVAAIARRR